MKVKPILLGVGGALFCSLSVCAEASIIYVNANHTDAPWNGRSWETAYRTVQPALQEAVSGDEIWVARGTYTPSSDDTRRQASFELQENVAVYGGFLGSETERTQRNWKKNVTVLSGNLGQGHHAYHVVIGANEALLDGFTVAEGCADGELLDQKGGGMLNRGKETTVVRHCTFKDNYAAWGGAIYNGLMASPVIEDTLFLSNKTEKGNVIVSQAGASPVVKNCKFKDNVRVKKNRVYQAKPITQTG